MVPRLSPLAHRPSGNAASDQTALPCGKDLRLAGTVLRPEPDFCLVVAAAGQPPVCKNRQRPDRAVLRKDRRLARSLLAELDVAVEATAGQPPTRHRQRGDYAGV